MNEAIKIEFGTVVNAFASRGHLPVIWVNGKLRGTTYCSTGYDQDDALLLAKIAADKEAARYVGDWDVV